MNVRVLADCNIRHNSAIYNFIYVLMLDQPSISHGSRYNKSERYDPDFLWSQDVISFITTGLAAHGML